MNNLYSRMLKCQTAFTEISQEDRNLEIMFTFVPDGSVHNPLNSCTSEVILRKPNPLGSNASGSDTLFERGSWFYHRKRGKVLRCMLMYAFLLFYSSWRFSNSLTYRNSMVVTAGEGWRMESVQTMAWPFPSQRCLSRLSWRSFE